MAITAKFVSDFTDFDKGVKDATAKLIDFESRANKAGKTSEEFGYTLVKATPGAAGFTDELKRFDSTLSAVGVNIGPAIRSITEIGEAATTSAEGMGLLGKAGLAIGTGLASYNLARFALEMTGLGTAVDTTAQKFWEWVASAKGFQSGAAEAAAVQDTINRAIANGAKDTITYAEAIEFNRKAADQYAQTIQRSVNPQIEMNAAMSAWQKEIREANKRGDLLSLNKALDDQNFSLKELSRMYGISVEALDYYKRKREETFRAQEQQDQASAAANARRVAEAEKAAAAEAKFAEDRFNQQLKLDEGLRASNDKLTQARLAQVNQGVLAELAAYQQLNPVIAEQDSIYTRLAAGQQQLAIAKAQGLPTLQQETLLHQQFGQALMDEALKEEQLRFKIEETTRARQVDNQAYIDAATSRGQDTLQFTPLSPGGLTGASWGDAGRLARMNEFYGASMDPITAAYRAAGIFTPTTGSAYRAPVTVNVSGNVLGTQQELARLVGDALSGNYRAGGNRAPI